MNIRRYIFLTPSRDDKPCFLVFHGGSGSSKEEFKTAIVRFLRVSLPPFQSVLVHIFGHPHQYSPSIPSLFFCLPCHIRRLRHRTCVPTVLLHRSLSALESSKRDLLILKCQPYLSISLTLKRRTVQWGSQSRRSYDHGLESPY